METFLSHRQSCACVRSNSRPGKQPTNATTSNSSVRAHSTHTKCSPVRCTKFSVAPVSFGSLSHSATTTTPANFNNNNKEKEKQSLELRRETSIEIQVQEPQSKMLDVQRHHNHNHHHHNHNQQQQKTDPRIDSSDNIEQQKQPLIQARETQIIEHNFIKTKDSSKQSDIKHEKESSVIMAAAAAAVNPSVKVRNPISSKLAHVKSRLKQPVASISWRQSSPFASSSASSSESTSSSSPSSSSSSSVSTPEESSTCSSIQLFAQQQQQQQHKGSRLAKPTTAITNAIARNRPNTLALKTTSNSTPSIVSSKLQSTLPKLTTAKLTTSTNATNTIPKGETKNANALGGVRNNSSTNNNNNIENKTNSSVKRKYAIGTRQSLGTCGTSSKNLADSDLSGLKNLVAVVHPQHSQRVNSSAKIVNKLSPTYVKSMVGSRSSVNNNNNTTKTATSTATNITSRDSGKKVNSNHKEVNVVRNKDTKQDERQFTSLRNRKTLTTTTVTTTTSTSIASSNYKNQVKSRLKAAISGGSVNTTTTTTSNNNNNNNGTKNGQSERENIRSGGGRLLSATNKINAKSDFHLDNKKYGNNKQSNNKHFPGQQSTSGQQKSETTLNGDEKSGELDLLSNNHDDDDDDDDDDDGDDDGLKPTTLTKSPAIYFKRDEQHAALNDRIRPKPMGQQVLSLMMLDVGLLPANNSNQCIPRLEDEQQKQQHHSPKKTSHVRLPSPPKLNHETATGTTVSSFLINSGHSSLPVSVARSERDSALRWRDNLIDFRQNFEQYNNRHIPMLSAHEALRVQVQLTRPENNNSKSLKSFSLPTSPRIPAHNGHFDNRFEKDHTNLNGAHELFLKPAVFSSCQSTAHLLGLDDEHSPLKTATSQAAFSCALENHYHHHHGNRYTNNQSKLSNGPCENQKDSHSLPPVSSSSSASINNNQFQPLLALSNELDSLRYREQVRANSLNKDGRQSYETLLQTRPSPYKDELRNNTPTPLDQVAQVEKQHEILFTNNSNCVSDDYYRTKIGEKNPIEKFDALGERSSEKGSKQAQLVKSQQDFYQAQSKEVILNGESFFPSPRSRNKMDSMVNRRQQQPRSHSIGGHDYYSNGNYQRLKQSVYAQQNLYDSHQLYYAQQQQTGNHLQSIPVTASYQNQPITGRTPSPLNINCQSEYDSSLRETLTPKYSINRQHQRNQLHASLECLNSAYSTENHLHQLQKQQTHFHQQQQQHHLHHQQQQQQQQQQLQQHHQTPNQHYAASYVLGQPPANTFMNQNVDQGLAGSPMGAPAAPAPQYHNQTTTSTAQSCNSPSSLSNSSSHYSNHTQNLINRAMAQVSQSPLRRIGLNGVASTNSGASNILNHLTNSHHSMRAGHSSLSLTSSSFIIEDKLQNEIRKLQCELKSEKEKNDALNSQLNINSGLMAAFEQSLTTLNTRLRQLTALNEKKDNEIEELKDQLSSSGKLSPNTGEKRSSPSTGVAQIETDKLLVTGSDRDGFSERDLNKVIDELKRQLIEKDRLLTDTRLEALNAAHQLEQLESRLNGEHSLLVNEDELDEGVMVVNHSPSDSEAVTDSGHLTEINDQLSKSNQRCVGDKLSFTLTNSSGIDNNNLNSCHNHNLIVEFTTDNNNRDDQSSHSRDIMNENKLDDHQELNKSISQQFNGSDSGVAGDLIV